MEFEATPLPGLMLVRPNLISDVRGSFMETWEARKFAGAGITASFVQDNHSHSLRGVLRGLHYQIRQPQGKLVRVTAGEIYDVVVDIRRHSTTFGRCYGAVLSAENRLELWVPEGFAHGFLVRSETADVVYKCTDFWAPEHERCILWSDPALGIDWGLTAGVEPALSDKDRRGSLLVQAEVFP